MDDRSAAGIAALALRQRDWPALERACAAWLMQPRAPARAHLWAGIAALEQRQIATAVEHLAGAARRDPADGEAAAQHARALSLAQRLPEAMEEAARALPLCQGDALALDTLGVVFSRGNAHAQAVAAFSRAVELQPQVAGYHFNLASALKFTGDFDGAERHYEACIARDAGYWRAHSALSQLRRQSAAANHVPRLRQLLGQAQGPEAALHLHLALYKEHEDLGDDAAAWAHLQAGKAARRALRPYRRQQDQAMFEALLRAFPDALPPADAQPPDEPIFVFGLPRTGTTLVERILSRHSQVHAAGELQNFGIALKRASGSRTPRVLDVDTIERAQRLDWAALGRRYVDSTRPGTGHTARFVDKLPHNFLYAGHIACALPHARMVCLRRDALDSCLGNYRQLFALNTPYFDYADDLDDTVAYYVLFDRLMAHWRRVLPGRVLELGYEEVVQAQESTTRRLLRFCNLDWEPACLDFSGNTAPVATASAVQVRAPLYRTSLQRWRRYQVHLQGARRQLAAAGIEEGPWRPPAGDLAGSA